MKRRRRSQCTSPCCGPGAIARAATAYSEGMSWRRSSVNTRHERFAHGRGNSVSFVPVARDGRRREGAGSKPGRFAPRRASWSTLRSCGVQRARRTASSARNRRGSTALNLRSKRPRDCRRTQNVLVTNAWKIRTMPKPRLVAGGRAVRLLYGTRQGGNCLHKLAQ